MKREDQLDQTIWIFFGVEISRILQNSMEAVVDLEIEVEILDQNHLRDAYLLRVLLHFLELDPFTLCKSASSTFGIRSHCTNNLIKLFE